MKKYIVLIISIILLCILSYSCKPIISTAYGVNKNISFEDRNAYINYLAKKHSIDKNKLYFIDEKSYDGFLQTIVNNKIDYFYGVFINDSMKVKKSDFLSENESCIGRVLNEINTISSGINSKTIEKDQFFKDNLFYNILNNQPLNFNNNRKKIVLIFSYKSGQLREKDFQEVEKLVSQNPGYELCIISIDRVFDF